MDSHITHSAVRPNKRMPYTIPEGSLDILEKAILQKTVEQPKVCHPLPSKASTWKRWLPSVIGAAAIALLSLLPQGTASDDTDDLDQVDNAFAHLSETDRNFLLDTYEDMDFINQL